MDLTECVADQSASALTTVSLIVMGDSGTGKSRLGALMPRPLILLLERQGLPTILQWNQKAVVVPLYQDDKAGTYTGEPLGLIRDPGVILQKLNHVLQAIFASRPNPDGPGQIVPSPVVSDATKDVDDFDFSRSVIVESCVVDTVTEFQQIQYMDLLGIEVFDLNNTPDEIPNKVWQTLKQRTLDLHRLLRDMPLHSLSLGHVAERDLRSGTKAMLAFFGAKAAPEVPRFANACGWLVNREIQGKVTRLCVFEGASEVAVTKWCSGLEAVEVVPANPSEGGPAQWIANILDADPGTKLGLPETKTIDPEEAMIFVRSVVGKNQPIKRKNAREEEGRASRAALLSSPATPAATTETETPARGRRRSLTAAS